MLKKSVFGMGLAAIAVLCLLMNASGNIVYSATFDNDDGELPNWQYWVDDYGNGIVAPQKNVVFSTHKSMLITSPRDHATKAWAKTPDLPAGYGDKPYVLEVSFYLPDTNNHWFYVMYNSHIVCTVDYYNVLVYRHDGKNEPLMTLDTGKWYKVLFDVHVKGDEKMTSPHVHIKISTGASSWSKDPFKLYSTAYTQNLYMGDVEETSTDYGTAFIDDVKLNDNIFYADFNSADRMGWNWDYTAGGYANIYITAKQGNSDTGSYSLRVHSENSLLPSLAWAWTPTYKIRTDKPYTVSMNIYIDCLFQFYFYLPYNGHIKCMLIEDQSWNVVLKWISGTSETSVKVLQLEKWYYLKFDVRPADKKYDIYIGYCDDNNGPVKKCTANFDRQTANNFLAIGDDDEDANHSNCGSAIIDNIRVEGTPS